MRKISNFIDNLKIKNKLFLLYISTFFIPLLLISLIFVYNLYNTLNKWENQQVEESFKKTESFFVNTIQAATELSSKLYVNRLIQNIVQKDFGSPLETYENYKQIGFVDDFSRIYSFVYNIRFYVENQNLQDNSFIVKTTNEVRQFQWYKQAKENSGKGFWTYCQDVIYKKDFLSFIQGVKDPLNGKFLGVLVLNLNSHFININLQNQIFETIIKYNGNIIFSSIEKENYEKIFIEEKIKTTNIEKEFFPLRDRNAKFKIIYLIPQNRLNKITTKVLIFSILILLVFLLLSLFLIGIFYYSFNTRVRIVQESVKNVVSQNFNINPSIHGKDEFSQIYESVYKMSVQIKNLIKEVYIKNFEQEQFESRQNAIRFKMLSAQINPHFLFNTIDNIRMKSLSLGNKDIPYMLKLLAKILRYNLTVESKEVPLFKEIEIISSYLEIQHKRFADRINYDISLLCDATKIEILPLLIQPIVENSFSHGLESKTEGGMIYILVQEIENKDKPLLSISIQDNGCGMPQEKIQELQEKLSNPSVEKINSSFGMVNVNQRIKLYYGKEYGITIKSKENEGTCVTITIPLKKQELKLEA